jgi:ribosomal-protein-alanine N-acetyltransferase
MVKMTYLVGEKIKLVKFTDRFITAKYIEWLNNHDINRYLCTGRLPISQIEVSNRNNNNNIMFAIMSSLFVSNDACMKDELYSNFIGTISLNSIDWITRKGEIGYMIGDKDYWGHGIATEAVKLISDYALNRLNLHKVEAGVVETNIGSIRVLIKNGFKEYAVIPDDYWIEGKYYGTHRFCKLQDNS